MKLGPVAVFFFFAQILSSQTQDGVDFLSAKIFIEPIPQQKQVKGQVTYKFEVLKSIDSIFLDAINIDFSSVLLDSKSVNYTNDQKSITLKKKFKKGTIHSISLTYLANPKQTVYFLGWDDSNPDNNQIWTQGQGKYTSHWLPSFDDMNEKVEFDLNLIAVPGYTVISNGKLTGKEELPDGKGQSWQFDMEQPMSSYLVGFAIGKFDKKTIQSSTGIPIELYYEPKDSSKVEPTYRHMRFVFDFLEKEINVPYPWQNYKQVPVQDFLYAGMENTGATIFSNTFMIDSIAFSDKNYVNVNAHELAHQWFGNLVTEQSGEHHWLHEGFATYYAYLAEKEIFGEDYFYWRLLDTAKSLINFSSDGNGEALTNSSAGSLTFYEKGAWALVMLRERVGDFNFRQGIQNYLTKYAYQNVTISDFMWEMEKASGMNLADFKSVWLQESEFPFETAKSFLIDNSNSIKNYFDIKSTIGNNFDEAETILTDEWNVLKSDDVKNRLVSDYATNLSAKFLGRILRDESSKVRQAVAFSIEKLPAQIRLDFESLLMDGSYKTVESALYRLWTDFPDGQTAYLEKTKDIVGLPNKNVRLLWLTLGLVSPTYRIDLKPEFFRELNSYTSSEHHFEVRLLAFQYLKNIGTFNDNTLKNLVDACSHHVWYFKKSSRKILKEFLKGDGNVARLRAIYPSLNQEQQHYLDKTLGK
ncbi:M1 family metallopeptidase [Flagellimonas sp. HMM57]|uniref:M1 family metallopeptidase n=1 Tax=unclassified Flagellimonas TaxID=2644544 RepID=UPI0013D49208|nr:MULTISPECIES: M1 family metallopeptidase [unclassified Flagellimonas]UII75702.1 M1 family metallopeptidase [Flagellimonas sp. HMM57]